MEETWLNTLKASLRIDYDAEDALLLDLLRRAKGFALNYTVPFETMDENKLNSFSQAVMMLAGHWYENPTATTTLSTHDNSFGFWTCLTPCLEI